MASRQKMSIASNVGAEMQSKSLNVLGTDRNPLAFKIKMTHKRKRTGTTPNRVTAHGAICHSNLMLLDF